MVRSNPPRLAVRLGALAASVIFAALSLPEARAQTPSADQIEMFRNLPPDQQQALMEALGGSRSGGQRPLTDRRLDFPETVQPRRVRGEATDEEGEEERFDRNGMPREPRLKGEDTV